MQRNGIYFLDKLFRGLEWAEIGEDNQPTPLGNSSFTSLSMPPYRSKYIHIPRQLWLNYSLPNGAKANAEYPMSNKEYPTKQGARESTRQHIGVTKYSNLNNQPKQD
jgi:hypothetical protein